MNFWMWFVFWLGVIAAIAQFREWLWRRKQYREYKPHRGLIPTAWSKDVLTYYKHNHTRRQLY